MHDFQASGAPAPLLWDELPELIDLAFSDVRMPPRVAAALVGYLEHQRVIRRRGDEAIIPGLATGADVPGYLRKLIEREARQSYCGLGPWIAYYFHPAGSHGPGIDISRFSNRSPSVASSVIVASIGNAESAYARILRNNPELAEFAYVIIGHIRACQWELLHEIMKPLKRSERAHLASGILRWDDFPSPASESWKENRSENQVAHPTMDREAILRAARLRIAQGLSRDAVGTLELLGFEARHARDIAAELSASGKRGVAAASANDHAMAAGVVGEHVGRALELPEGSPVAQLTFIHQWLEGVLADVKAGDASVRQPQLGIHSEAGRAGPEGGYGHSYDRELDREKMTYLQSAAAHFDDLHDRRHAIPLDELVEDIRREAERVGRAMIEDEETFSDGPSVPWRMAARERTDTQMCRFHFSGEPRPVDVRLAELLTRQWRKSSYDERCYSWSPSELREWILRHVFYEFAANTLASEWDWPGSEFVVGMGQAESKFLWDVVREVRAEAIEKPVVPGAVRFVAAIPVWVRDLPRWLSAACRRVAEANVTVATQSVDLSQKIRHPAEKIAAPDRKSSLQGHVGYCALLDAEDHCLTGNEIYKLDISRTIDGDNATKAVRTAIIRHYPQLKTWLKRSKAGRGRDSTLRLLPEASSQ